MKKIGSLLIILVLFSCTENSIIEKPKDLIPKDTMVLLLTDLFIAKSAFTEKNLNNNRKINYMPLVYNKYKIDSARFISSNLFYTSKFEEYELIYKEVNEKLYSKKALLEQNIKRDTKDEIIEDEEDFVDDRNIKN